MLDRVTFSQDSSGTSDKLDAELTWTTKSWKEKIYAQKCENLSITYTDIFFQIQIFLHHFAMQ